MRDGIEKARKLVFLVVLLCLMSLLMLSLMTDKALRQPLPTEAEAPSGSSSSSAGETAASTNALSFENIQPRALEQVNVAGNRVILSTALSRTCPTILYFHSNNCSSCRQMEALLEKLAGADTNVKIAKVDIDQAASGSPDFDSPVAQQFDLHYTPYFRIYDAERNCLISGKEAKAEIKLMLMKYGIAR
ncbi:MAG: thioredoxin family protein [Candidatus Obscuribacterales bacterium]|nr:thioredoxin family protein [Candidatus Obscuribacterales bacterium]